MIFFTELESCKIGYQGSCLSILTEEWECEDFSRGHVQVLAKT